MKKEKIPFPKYKFDAEVISPELKEQIYAKKGEGDNFQMEHKYLKAIEKFKEAWELLPEPKYQWKYVFVLLSSIAENYRLNGKFNAGKGGGFEESLEFLRMNMSIESEFRNAYNHVEIGNVYYDMGKMDKAIQEFVLAYLLEDNKLTIKMQLGGTFYKLIEPIINDEEKLSKYIIDEETYIID